MPRIIASEKGFGDELIHYDETGMIAGFSRKAFAGDDYETYDLNGNWIGVTSKAFNSQLVHYGLGGELLGTSFIPAQIGQYFFDQSESDTDPYDW